MTTPAAGNIVLAATPSTLPLVLAEAAGYDYGGQYTLTINVSDGVCAGGIVLPPLANYPGPQVPFGSYPALIGNVATPGNCIISNGSGPAVTTRSGALWSMSGFRLKSTTGQDSDLQVLSYSNVQINNIDFAGSGILLNVSDHSSIYAINASLSSSSAAFTTGLNVTFYGSFINDGAIWTINGSPTASDVFANVGDHSILGDGTYVNGNTVRGKRFILFNFGIIEYTGSINSFPGNGGTVIETGSIFVG